MEGFAGGLAEAFQSTRLPSSAIAIRLVTAALLGAVLGFEREWNEKSAGLRTHMITALAAATFAVLMIEIVARYEGAGDNVRSDPIRLIDSITAGVAFLAAGVILHARGHVRGLTTGAGMWLAGAIGAAAGLGYLLVAFLASLIGLFIFIVLRSVSDRVPVRHGEADEAGEVREAEGESR